MPVSAADHSWVGVLRAAPACIKWPTLAAALRAQQVPVCDGWCPGWIEDVRGYDQIYPAADGRSLWVNYGCWFYMSHNASAYSGAVVNVGRSLRVRTRCEVNRAFGLPVRENKQCADNPGDKLWCHFARLRGLDSIQILYSTYAGARGKKPGFSELVVCSDECGQQTFNDSACVPVARAVARDGDSQPRPCHCPAGRTVLSCNARTPLLDGSVLLARKCNWAFRFLDAVPD